MAYATINELKVRLGQDYAGLYGNDEAGTATAQADLDAAAAEIDASAGCRYETPVTSETKVLCVTVQNDSRRTLSFGVDAFELMKEGANGWETLEKLPHAVIEIARLLYPSDSTTIRVDLPALYGRTLSPGTYRFVFQFRMENRREPEYCMAQTDFIVTE